jgi:hypothetical protein
MKKLPNLPKNKHLKQFKTLNLKNHRDLNLKKIFKKKRKLTPVRTKIRAQMRILIPLMLPRKLGLSNQLKTKHQFKRLKKRQ